MPRYYGSPLHFKALRFAQKMHRDQFAAILANLPLHQVLRHACEMATVNPSEVHSTLLWVSEADRISMLECISASLQTPPATPRDDPDAPGESSGFATLARRDTLLPTYLEEMLLRIQLLLLCGLGTLLRRTRSLLKSPLLLLCREILRLWIPFTVLCRCRKEHARCLAILRVTMALWATAAGGRIGIATAGCRACWIQLRRHRPCRILLRRHPWRRPMIRLLCSPRPRLHIRLHRWFRILLWGGLLRLRHHHPGLPNRLLLLCRRTLRLRHLRLCFPARLQLLCRRTLLLLFRLQVWIAWGPFKVARVYRIECREPCSECASGWCGAVLDDSKPETMMHKHRCRTCYRAFRAKQHQLQ